MRILPTSPVPTHSFSMKLYLPLGQLSGGHTDSINSAGFSVDGKSLATGSEEGGLVIWSVEDGLIVERRLLNSSILTVMWDSHVPKRLYFGCMDGTAAYIDKPHVRPILLASIYISNVEAGSHSPYKDRLIQGSSLRIRCGAEDIQHCVSSWSGSPYSSPS